MARNFGQLDLLFPGALAFKDLINANLEAIDRMQVVQRTLPVDVSSFVTAGSIVAYTSTGLLTDAIDGVGYDPIHQPIGFALDSSVFTGDPVRVRMVGRTVSGLVVSGSPSIGDMTYLSDTNPGEVTTTRGPNSVACGVFLGSNTIFFRPRLLP